MWLNCPRCLKEYVRCSCQYGDLVANNTSTTNSLINTLKKLSEKKPMTQKTENLTTEEAWAAMARGECVLAMDGELSEEGTIHRIHDNSLAFWNEQWISTSILDSGPYSIVPDPSKPTLNEYDKSKADFIMDFGNAATPETRAELIAEFIDNNYQRKP